MKRTKVSLVDPGGNITAIVSGDCSAHERHEINKKILRSNLLIEQVLFVQNKEGVIHGEMAGGEFCANAARALGYVLAHDYPSVQTFSMSGVSSPVVVSVTKEASSLKVSTDVQQEKAVFSGQEISIIHLEGISHAIICSGTSLYQEVLEHVEASDWKEYICRILTGIGLSERPASGVMLVDVSKDECALKPFVYVRDIKTLYEETACASGSIALSLLLGKSCLVKQPSGAILEVELISDNEVSVSGPIKMVQDEVDFDDFISMR